MSTNTSTIALTALNFPPTQSRKSLRRGARLPASPSGSDVRSRPGAHSSPMTTATAAPRVAGRSSDKCRRRDVDPCGGASVRPAFHNTGKCRRRPRIQRRGWRMSVSFVMRVYPIAAKHRVEYPYPARLPVDGDVVIAVETSDHGIGLRTSRHVAGGIMGANMSRFGKALLGVVAALVATAGVAQADDTLIPKLRVGDDNMYLRTSRHVAGGVLWGRT